MASSGIDSTEGKVIAKFASENCAQNMVGRKGLI